MSRVILNDKRNKKVRDNKSLPGANEEVRYSGIKKDDDNWVVMFRCAGCGEIVKEPVLFIPEFDWEDWKFGKDCKTRIFHACSKNDFHYTTVIIKAKRGRD